jgi:cell division protein FtsB
LKQKYTKRIQEIRKENNLLRSDNRNLIAEVELANTKIKQLVAEKETMEAEIKNLGKQQ